MSLRNYLDKIRPNFEEGGKLHAFRSVYDGFDTFLYVPHTTSKSGVSIHDAIDSKRIMSFVVIALLPAMLFGMYNIGYQNAVAAGKLAEASFMGMFLYGFAAMLPKILVSYIVGLGIEFAWAQYKGEEIQEGYLVSGILIPLIIPVSTPLWILALAVAFAVVIGKEIFGGTGMNVFNPALLARAFLFFSYPSSMTGDTIWVATEPILGMGFKAPDGYTMATPLGEIAQHADVSASFNDMIIGLIPGSMGETSVIAIAIGAVILLWTGIASWKTMLSVFLGGGLMAVDPGQMEAGRSLGLNYITTMVVIIIPQAIRAVLPALGNEFIMLLKDTSLITVIGGKELLYAAQGIMNRTYEAMFPLFGVALIYLVLVMIFTWLLAKFERRLAQSDR